MKRSVKRTRSKSEPIDSIREQAFDLRKKGLTYALIEKQLGIPYLQAKELGKAYDAAHGRPDHIVRTLRGETLPTGLTSIPVRDLRNDTARILGQVEKGRRFLITVSGRGIAELGPVVSRSHFVPRAVVESILREAPLDRAFLSDLNDAIGQRVDEI